MLDTLINGGTIINGRGGERFVGDVGIKDGIITEIGSEISSAAKHVVDADGAIITPGFVDIHTHFDGQVSWDDKMDPSFSCLLYTSPSPRDRTRSRMPSSA